MTTDDGKFRANAHEVKFIPRRESLPYKSLLV